MQPQQNNLLISGTNLKLGSRSNLLSKAQEKNIINKTCANDSEN